MAETPPTTSVPSIIPLKELEESKYKINSLLYPANLPTISRHYMQFSIFANAATRNEGGTRPLDGSARLQGGGRTKASKSVRKANYEIYYSDESVLEQLSGDETLSNEQKLELSRKKVLLQPNDLAFRGSTYWQTKSFITMYMPDQLNLSWNNQWETVSLRDKMGNITSSIVGGMNDISGMVSSGNLNLGTTAGNIINAIQLISGKMRGPAEVGQAMLGQAINPMNEVFFRGLENRQFQFTFKMTPRDEKESQVIRDIIKEFEYHAAPELGQGGEYGNFMIAPSLFDISFGFEDRENDFLRKISTCALRRIDVNYTDNGIWAAMKNGAPVSTQLTLDFVELDLITKDRVMEGY